ncbi:OmpA family protein [Phytohabitans sp. LJ34]|uniref:OmpA family protein n=1 Tax=Phytohabitans sp. LJ34 TaxID=3452217 RepID=UPI003F8AD2DD
MRTPPRSRYAARGRSRFQPRRSRRWPFVAATVAVALVVAVGGFLYWRSTCEPGDPACEVNACTGSPTQMTFALGARANSPEPLLPPKLESEVSAAARAGKEIVVYRVDGKPSTALRSRFETKIKAKEPYEEALEAFMTKLNADMSQIRAAKPEANPLEALWLASRDTPAGGTVVLFDSGLQTTGALNFRTEGMLEADPQEVVDDLAKREQLPDLDGRRVVLMGIGDAIDPQAKLDQNLHDNVVAIWEAIAREGGAECVDVLPDPPVREIALSGVPKVTPIGLPKPPPPLRPCTEVVLSDGGDVGFKPRTPELRDPSAARERLSGYANTIRNDRSIKRVEILGTTARWNSPESQKELGKERAEVVKDILVSQGVSAGMVTTEGVGSYSKYYVPDGGPKGPLKPAEAARNRSIVLRTICESRP